MTEYCERAFATIRICIQVQLPVLQSMLTVTDVTSCAAARQFRRAPTGQRQRSGTHPSYHANDNLSTTVGSRWRCG